MKRMEGEGGLRIQLLGRFRVWSESQLIPDTAWRRRKAASLIKLLALAPEHRLQRDEMLELLWPGLGTEPATNNLHRTLHIVRHALDPDLPLGERSRYLSLQGDLLVLCPQVELHVDVDDFLEAARIARQSQNPTDYEQAVSLYAGHLLPEDQYEDWATERREEVQRLYHDLLRRLSRLYEERGQCAPAIEVLQRLVTSEPAEEEAHLQLMRLYALSGQRRLALQQYARLTDFLRRDVDAEPDAPTRQLYKEIREGRFPPVPDNNTASTASVGPPEPTEAVGVATPEKQVSKPSNEHPANASPPTNLPRQLNGFIGRTQEMVEVKRLLSSAGLLTLIGAGGVGKSRLAVQVGAEELREYGDGVWLVQLAALSDAPLVPQTVAGALNIREQPGRPMIEVLVESLHTKQTLLILDNCEHLLNACAEVAETLLGSCPHLRILATSRQALGVAGEVVWRVPSMKVPEATERTTLDTLPHADAVSLFLERTHSVRPDFVLTPENAPAVVEVCRRLDGIPLAIELAAARMRVLTVEQLAERLDDCFAVLGGGSTSPLSRHRTLRTAMDWSYDLLGEPEQQLFRRLAVFADGWTLEAAEDICGGQGIEEGQVLELLSTLVDQSLVVVAKQGAAMRYRLQEPVRLYAAQKLAAAGEREELSCRHAHWYRELAEKAELRGPQQTAWFARLESEHDNLRAALQWARNHDQQEVLCRLAAALWRFWWVRGHLKEGRGWLEAALAIDGPPTAWRARTLEGAGVLAWALEDYATAFMHYQDSLALWRRLGDQDGVARLLMDLGVLASHEGDTERAVALFEESLALFRSLTDQMYIAVVLGNLAGIASQQGEMERALALERESLAASRQVGDRVLIARHLNDLATMVLDVGDATEAEELEHESLVIRRDLGDRGGICECLEVLAETAIVRCQAVRAAILEGAAEGLREAIGLPLPSDGRRRHARYLDRLQSQLDQRKFAEAQAEGRAMRLEEAIDYALSPNEASAAGHTPLTPRQREVAVLVAQGFTNHEIAEQLGMSEQTVAVHVHRILKKLGITSRKGIAIWTREQGLAPSGASQDVRLGRTPPSPGSTTAPSDPQAR